MDVYEIIENLEELVDGAFTIPILNRALLNRDELMDTMSELRLKLPEDLKTAKRITQDRTRIVTEAHQEAQNIIKGTEEKITQMVNEHEITKQAYEQANEIIESAKQHAREIRLGSREWADKLLEDLENRLTYQVEMVKSGRQEMKK